MTHEARSPSAEDSALAAIVRSSHDAVIAKTTDGIVTAWNDGAAAIYGYPPEAIHGKNIDLTFPPETREYERDRHARVAAGEALSGYRCVRLRMDGRRVEVVMSMLPVRDHTGMITGVASISRLPSEHERASERFAALLEAAPDAMICVDTSGVIRLANARVSSLFGYDRDALLGRPVEVLVPGALREHHIGHRDGFFAAPTARPMGSGLLLTAQRRDGSTFPAEVSLSATEATADSEPLVIAAVRDVSEKRAIEASLRESEIRLRQLAENVGAVFILLQVEPRVLLYISPQFESLTGYSPQEMFDDPGYILSSLVHPDDREQVLEQLERSFTHLESTRSEHRMVCRDGSIRWVRAVYRPVPPVANQPARLAGTIEDVTERVVATRRLADAEAEARAANEAKNEFLSRMSHELRTPLNAVLGFAQLLELELVDTRQVESVHHILHAGRHLLALINDVLDIARIEAGEMSISLEPVSVRSMVYEVCRLMEPIASNLNVSLRLEGDGQECFALADSQRLRQILLNLVTNAIKYNHPGGQVWLSWSWDDRHVSVEVGDDGPGIASHLQSRLFTPFDRLGAEATSVEGTGVGLAVTRGLAELMDSRVNCFSELGRGSVFTVTLPKAMSPTPSAASGTQRPADRISPLPDGARTLLYIEDNIANVKLLEAVLTLRTEWNLVHAALGGLGVELARVHEPDLVLLDLHLPDGPGLDVLLTLRSDPATAHVPIVVLSADASPSHVRSLLEAGAERYLTKPLDLDEVLRVLDKVADAGNIHPGGQHER